MADISREAFERWKARPVTSLATALGRVRVALVYPGAEGAPEIVEPWSFDDWRENQLAVKNMLARVGGSD